MNINSIIIELDEVIDKLKKTILYYQEENKQLRNTIKELKKYVLTL